MTLKKLEISRETRRKITSNSVSTSFPIKAHVSFDSKCCLCQVERMLISMRWCSFPGSQRTKLELQGTRGRLGYDTSQKVAVLLSLSLLPSPSPNRFSPTRFREYQNLYPTKQDEYLPSVGPWTNAKRCKV